MILFLCMPKEKVSKKKRQLTKRATPEVFFRDRQELAPTRKPTQSSDILPVFRSKALVRLTPFFVERRLRRQSIYWPMTTLCEVPDFPPFCEGRLPCDFAKGGYPAWQREGGV